jgi:hypothetical protein
MKKLKHGAELFKAALLAGVQYAQGRKAVEFEATDSASDKALYVHRLLVHDKVISPNAGRASRREDGSGVGSQPGTRISCLRDIRCWNSPHAADSAVQ